jgi:hypothetical protein
MRISLYSILYIVVRLGAILLFVRVVEMIFAAFSFLQNAHSSDGIAGMMIGYIGVVVMIAVALWLYPGLLVRLVAGRSRHRVFAGAIDAAQLQYIAFATLGMAFVMYGLMDLIPWGIRTIVGINTMVDMESRRYLLLEFVSPLTKVVLGAGLAMGARGLTGALAQFRERGLPPPIAAQPEAGESERT